MVYQDKFVAEVKSSGKILRMKDGYVSLPFGSEYTILLKNLSSRKASVKISIDGDDVLGGSSLILDPNTESELKGFLNGNVAKNSFRFIQKTEEIANHRGDRIDDGIIRIEFAYEKENKLNVLLENKDVHVYHHWNYDNWFTGDSTVKYSSDPMSHTINSGDITGAPLSSITCQQSLGQTPMPDEGITVKGSEINQHFNYACIGELENSQVIIIRLKGMTASGKVVQTPLTVKDKLECPTCGRKSNSSFKFCPNCGTFLE